MQTDALILSLGQNLRPVPPRAVERRTLVALATGSVLALMLIATVLGFRDDIPRAMDGTAFWIKALYTGSLAIGAIAATIQLSRPDAARPHWLWLLLIPVALLVLLSVGELAHTPAADWPVLVRGISWQRCSANVVLLSVPLFAALIWAFRQFAPQNLRLAGGAAGLASGATGATLYGLHCPEASATFVLIWYTLGISIAALAGVLAGPRLLRW